MRESSGGEFPVSHDIVGKARSQARRGAPRQTLRGCVFTVAGSIGFHIGRQRQANAHHADRYEAMRRAVRIALGIPDRVTEWARFFVGVSGAGAIHSQADEAAVLEGLVALGLVERGGERQPLPAQGTCHAQDAAHRHCAFEIRGGDVRVGAAIAGLLEAGSQARTVTGVVMDLGGMRPGRRGGCRLRHSTSSSALAVRTLRKAS